MSRKNKQKYSPQHPQQQYHRSVQQPVRSRGKNPLTPLWFILSIAIIILAQNLGWFEGMAG